MPRITTLSELVDLLEDALTEHGDVPIELYSPDGELLLRPTVSPVCPGTSYSSEASVTLTEKP